MLFCAGLTEDSRYPAGVFNLVNGRGAITGDVMARHMGIDKVSIFTI